MELSIRETEIIVHIAHGFSDKEMDHINYRNYYIHKKFSLSFCEQLCEHLGNVSIKKGLPISRKSFKIRRRRDSNSRYRLLHTTP